MTGYNDTRVLDVSNPEAIRQVASLPTASRLYSLESANNSLVFAAAGYGGLESFDLSDPKIPA
jgi:hypothetical protein